MRDQTPDHERGAALITALMVVAFMAAVSVSLVEMMRHQIERTRVVEDRLQASAYLDGAVAYGEVLLARFAGGADEDFTPEGPWDGVPRVFPIENGQIIASIRDSNNCLNINALHSGDMAADERAAARLRSLLQAVGLPPGETETLIAAATDWIDPDRTARPGGAEDDTYLARAEPHRAANQPFTELGEMRLLPGVTRALFETLAPYLCALPTSVQAPLNVNTLRADQAVLITALSEGSVSLQAAGQALFRRPSTGYSSLEAFWADPVMAVMPPEERPLSLTALRSEWFELNLAVELGEMRLMRVQTVRMDTSGAFTRLPPVQGAVL
ncbi:MAG: type II secretion system minor pseudopilin GspK [Caulobacterales bacterium]|uniref:type II secretion system minor pseudopilin GspK n=1 Tax=Glycocaulis sp. TaxID=1969725 RepID=UPI003F9EFD2E